MLKNGEIDLMGALSYTDERAENMLFSELPMGEEKYYLYADLVHTDISASDLSTLNGRRIDMIKNGVQISIHAPAKGATLRQLRCDIFSIISIHAPAKGATAVAPALSSASIISIHAPAKGATMM